MTVAALYVEPGGVYYGLPDVEPWGLPERDARLYAGPWPVVAHPPCERWGDQWHGCRPVGHPKRGKKGDDGGCFTAALGAVRTWGGVLEHPADSKAWQAHGLPGPMGEGWHLDVWGGWCCRVEQGHYGHPAGKPTWLYFVGMAPPALKWGPSGAGPMTGSKWDRGGGRSHSPPAFAALLLSLARLVRKKEAA